MFVLTASVAGIEGVIKVFRDYPKDFMERARFVMEDEGGQAALRMRALHFEHGPGPFPQFYGAPLRIRSDAARTGIGHTVEKHGEFSATLTVGELSEDPFVQMYVGTQEHGMTIHPKHGNWLYFPPGENWMDPLRDERGVQQYGFAAAKDDLAGEFVFFINPNNTELVMARRVDDRDDVSLAFIRKESVTIPERAPIHSEGIPMLDRILSRLEKAAEVIE